MTVIAEQPSFLPEPEGQGSTGLVRQLPQVLATSFEGYPLWEAATDVEAQVFIDCGYVHSKEELTREYAPYLARTTMMALLLGDEVVGAARVSDRVREVGEYGFKTLNDAHTGRLELSESGLEILRGIDLDRTQEIGTIALKEEYRGNHMFKLVGYLYDAIHRRALANGYDSTIASFDKSYFGGFRFRFRPAVRPLGPAVEYMGSPTVPAHIDIPQIDPARIF